MNRIRYSWVFASVFLWSACSSQSGSEQNMLPQETRPRYSVSQPVRSPSPRPGSDGEEASGGTSGGRGTLPSPETSGTSDAGLMRPVDLRSPEARGLVEEGGRYVDPMSVSWRVPSDRFNRIDAGRTCAINLLGQQECWAQVWGVGLHAPRNGPSGFTIVSIAQERSSQVGDHLRLPHHQCVIGQASNGYTRVFCSGTRAAPVLGPNAPSSSVSSSVWYAVPMPNNRPVVQLVSGSAHACARTDRNEVFCWGSNFDGQLGVLPAGTSTTTAQPVRAQYNGHPLSALDLAASGNVTCAVTQGNEIRPEFDLPEPVGEAFCVGRVYAWDGSRFHFKSGVFGITGRDLVSTSGLGSWTPPSRFHTQGGFSRIEISEHAGCVTRASNGRLYCWRIFDDGHVPHPTTHVRQIKAQELLPIDGIGVPLVPSHFTVANGLACATNSANLVYCWGGQGAVFGIAGSTISVSSSTARSWSSRFRPYPVNRPPARATGVSFNGLTSVGQDDGWTETIVGGTPRFYGVCLSTSDSRVHCYGYGADGVKMRDISGVPNEIPLTRAYLGLARPF